MNEIAELIKAKGLFRPGGAPPNASRVHVIHDLRELEEHATDDAALAGDEDSALPWIDVKRENLHVFYNALRTAVADQTAFELDMERQDRELLPLIEAQLTGRVPPDLIYDIADDLAMIMRFRAVLGDTPHMLNKMYEVYRTGGIPCGWEGRHPDGQLIGYYTR